jgi:hypothetical protein
MTKTHARHCQAPFPSQLRPFVSTTLPHLPLPTFPPSGFPYCFRTMPLARPPASQIPIPLFRHSPALRAHKCTVIKPRPSSPTPPVQTTTSPGDAYPSSRSTAAEGEGRLIKAHYLPKDYYPSRYSYSTNLPITSIIRWRPCLSAYQFPPGWARHRRDSQKDLPNHQID